ncbi:MAG: prolyl-tRNA synthetase associated domain-containing protein [Rhodobiaceae bacterium]|nr:prolyl-tRNA synthetase associated domain-containing protein [Rhodobiaceae bacterium]
MTSQDPSSPAEAPPAAPRRDPVGKEGLLTVLQDLEIAATTIDHPPLHAVDDAQAWRAANMAEQVGGFCKNLFLKDKKGALWLVVTLEERNIRLNSLAKPLGSARLSFAKPELLWETLGVRPGSVTPFALINDGDRRVRLILDAPMMEHDWLNYHPLTNEATTTISKADFLKFIRHCGHEPTIIDLEAAAGL